MIKYANMIYNNKKQIGLKVSDIQIKNLLEKYIEMCFSLVLIKESVIGV